MHYTLKERLLLAEDSTDPVDESTLDKKLNEIIDFTDKFRDIAETNNSIADSGNKLISVYNHVKDVIGSNSTDFSKQHGAIVNYYNQIKDYFTYSSRPNFLKELKTAIEDSNGVDKDDPKAIALLKIFDIVGDKLTAILSGNNSAIEKELINKINDLNTNANIALKNTKKIEAETDENVTAGINELQAVTIPTTDEGILELIRLGTGTGSALNTLISTLTDSINKLLATLNDDAGIDDVWNTRYKALLKNIKAHSENASELNSAFWKSYFTEVWGSLAKRVYDLGVAFRDELITLGFDEAKNPFITFVKTAFGSAGLDIKSGHYAVIHNSAKHGDGGKAYITTSDLRHGEHSNDTIIYNKNLYKIAADTFEEYIQLTSQIKNRYNRTPTGTGVKEKYDQAWKIVYAALNSDLYFKNDGELNDNLPDVDDSAKIKEITNFRRIDEIRNFYEVCFGETIANKLDNADAESIKALFGGDTNKIKAAILWLAWCFTDDKIDLAEYVDRTYGLNPATLTIAAAKESSKIIHKKYNFDLTSATAKNCIDTFANAAGITKVTP